MALCGNVWGTTRNIFGVYVAVTVALANIDEAFADVSWDQLNQHAGPAVMSGTAAMLRLRVPFGGADRQRSQPTLALTAGPEWQELAGSPNIVRYSSGEMSVEAGWTFAGEQFVRAGSVDMLNVARVRVNASGLDDVPTWVYIAGGIALVAIVVVVASSRKSYGNSSGMGSSGAMGGY